MLVTELKTRLEGLVMQKAQLYNSLQQVSGAIQLMEQLIKEQVDKEAKEVNVEVKK